MLQTRLRHSTFEVECCAFSRCASNNSVAISAGVLRVIIHGHKPQASFSRIYNSVHHLARSLAAAARRALRHRKPTKHNGGCGGRVLHSSTPCLRGDAAAAEGDMLLWPNQSAEDCVSSIRMYLYYTLYNSLIHNSSKQFGTSPILLLPEKKPDFRSIT